MDEGEPKKSSRNMVGCLVLLGLLLVVGVGQQVCKPGAAPPPPAERASGVHPEPALGRDRTRRPHPATSYLDSNRSRTMKLWSGAERVETEITTGNTGGDVLGVSVVVYWGADRPPLTPGTPLWFDPEASEPHTVVSAVLADREITEGEASGSPRWRRYLVELVPGRMKALN